VFFAFIGIAQIFLKKMRKENLKMRVAVHWAGLWAAFGEKKNFF